jgi:opacity protein-like surface antigen
MRKVLGLLTLMAMLAAPSLAMAETGFYVAPKFIYGYTQMNNLKATGDVSENDEFDVLFPFSFGLGGKGSSTAGGALAIGFDFSKQFDAPIRAELQYSIFGNNSSGEKVRGVYMPEIDTDVDAFYGVGIKQKLQIQTLMANFYFDIHNDTDFTPYLGAGLGLAFIRNKGNGGVLGGLIDTDEDEAGGDFQTFSLGGKTKTNFAWSVGGGVAYEATEFLTVDLGYNFVGLGKANTRTASGVLAFDVDGDPYEMPYNVRGKTGNIYMHQVALGFRFTF